MPVPFRVAFSCAAVGGAGSVVTLVSSATGRPVSHHTLSGEAYTVYPVIGAPPSSAPSPQTMSTVDAVAEPGSTTGAGGATGTVAAAVPNTTEALLALLTAAAA